LNQERDESDKMRKNTTLSPTARLPIGFAHRGARSERRENTLEAFSRALELGATGLESDAWLSGDGVVVLDHDGVTGPPWKRRALSVQERSALPGHMPSLAELYETCGTGFDLSLDLKDPGALDPVLDVARRFGASERLWLCYHDWRPMAAWRRAAPEIQLVESTNIHWMKEGLGGRVSALAGAGLHAVNLHGSQWDEANVREARAAGILAFAWDAQSDADLDRLLSLGIDGVYSDHVDRMVAAIARAHRASGRGPSTVTV
jgi:glycerophosphoryl diester phosphodiesterase